MNEVRERASDWVQRAAIRFNSHDRRARSSDRPPRDFRRRQTMLKTISAALLAASVLCGARDGPQPGPNAHMARDRDRARDSRACSTPMPGWVATITAIITGIITSISVITIASTIIAETDPRARLHPHCPRRDFADISPGPHAIASPMAAGRYCFFRQAFGVPVRTVGRANSNRRGEGLERLVKAGE